jgi:hypothetical protein
LLKHHSYDKTGNKSSVRCKYVIKGVWIWREHTVYIVWRVVHCVPKLIKVHILKLRLWPGYDIISLAEGCICYYYFFIVYLTFHIQGADTEHVIDLSRYENLRLSVKATQSQSWD